MNGEKKKRGRPKKEPKKFLPAIINKPEKEKKEKKKTGRPKKELDVKTLNMLCGLQCTGEEVAAFLGMSYDTLELRIKEEFQMSFPEYFKQKSSLGKVSLRRKQMQMAMKGSVPMAIFLGKNMLGQADKVEGKVDLSGAVTFIDDIKGRDRMKEGSHEG